MAHFAKTSDGYTIIHAGQATLITAEEAYSLLCELYDHSDELWQALHPEMDISQVTTEFLRTPGKAYQEQVCHFCGEKYNAAMRRCPTCLTPKKQES